MSPTIKKFHRIEAMFKDVKQNDCSIEYFFIAEVQKGTTGVWTRAFLDI